MQRIDGPTRSATLPAPAATGTGSNAPGYFTRGSAADGVPATTLDADWANMVQEELLGPVLAAGLAPSKSNRGQLLAALQMLFVPAGEGSGAVTNGTEITIPLPGGYLLKIGQTAIGNGSNSVGGQIAFATSFPNGCIFIGGNADGKANANWGPVVVMVSSPTKDGAAFLADTANQGQSISAGRTLRWIAVGN